MGNYHAQGVAELQGFSEAVVETFDSETLPYGCNLGISWPRIKDLITLHSATYKLSEIARVLKPVALKNLTALSLICGRDYTTPWLPEWHMLPELSNMGDIFHELKHVLLQVGKTRWVIQDPPEFPLFGASLADVQNSNLEAVQDSLKDCKNCSKGAMDFYNNQEQETYVMERSLNTRLYGGPKYFLAAWLLHPGFVENGRFIKSFRTFYSDAATRNVTVELAHRFRVCCRWFRCFKANVVFSP